VVNSKAFDNGVVCGSENNLLVDAQIADEFLDQTRQVGAAVLTEAEITLLLEQAFEHNTLASKFIGQSAAIICDSVGIHRDYPIQLIIAEVPAGEPSTPLVREKLAPILSLIRVTSEEEALFHARTILSIEGRGHTAIIHSQDRDRVRRFANAVEVSRVLVNSAGTLGCIGACNDLPLSWTLGCGTMGGGSTSDNVTYKHLQNTKRIAWAS
jgi:acetaldehyde dehydrogenase/alcohol dehydrogenase